MKKKFTVKNYIPDTILCILLISLILLFSVLFFTKRDTDYARITLDGEEFALLPLSQDISDFHVGNLHIRVQNGRAFIYESDCPDKVCMGMSGVDKNGGGAVCIPNRVVLEPYGISDKSELDSVVG